ncbi:DUF4365 domain-containing protein [Natrinema soli]|uniref:DUF4365 domain-containing protein n=1 Tax=Natrinema soli TaxID=1930624 RepID=A0ABD5SKF6_9EURY|nr:DUF4365 domain-containing protein [Natrinema soli]
MNDDSSEDGSEEFGPARYPDTDVDEADTGDVLNSVIDRNHAKLEFQTLDKLPNRDGSIEVVNEDGVPVGLLLIQVKKLNDSDLDPPKFQCPRKYFEYSRVISSPFLLIGVDTVNEVAYWKHFSPEWVDALDLGSKQSKVVHFPEENILDGSSTQYVSDWKEISEDNKRRIRNYDEFERLKEIATPALGESRPEFETIHRFLDEYNGYIDGKFSIIRERLYPGLWKFGFANLDYSDDSVKYGLYPIKQTENDVQIKDLEFPEKGSLFEKYDLSLVSRREHDNFVYNLEENALRHIESVTEDIISKHVLRHTNSEFICREIVFAFVDELYRMLDLDERESYTLEELEYSFDTYLHVWIDTALDWVDEDIDIAGSLIRNQFPSDLLMRISLEDRPRIHEEVESRLDSDESLGFKYRYRAYDMSERVFEEALDALRRRGVETVERPYPIEDLDMDDHDYIWSEYSSEAFEDYVKAYMRNLVEAYRKVSAASFPDMEGVFDDFQGVTDIVVELDAEGRPEEVGPVYYQYWLRDMSGGESEDVSLHFCRKDPDDGFVIDFNDQSSFVNFEGEKYEKMIFRESSLSELLREPPVMSEVYSRIMSDLDEEYFDDV